MSRSRCSNATVIGLAVERTELHERIARRVDHMWAAGLGRRGARARATRAARGGHRVPRARLPPGARAPRRSTRRGRRPSGDRTSHPAVRPAPGDLVPVRPTDHLAAVRRPGPTRPGDGDHRQRPDEPRLVRSSRGHRVRQGARHRERLRRAARLRRPAGAHARTGGRDLRPARRARRRRRAPRRAQPGRIGRPVAHGLPQRRRLDRGDVRQRHSRVRPLSRHHRARDAGHTRDRDPRRSTAGPAERERRCHGRARPLRTTRLSVRYESASAIGRGTRLRYECRTRT